MANQQEVLLRSWEFANSDDISIEEIISSLRDLINAGNYEDVGVVESNALEIPSAAIICRENANYLHIYNYLYAEGGSIFWISSIHGKGEQVNAKDMEKMYHKAAGAWGTFKASVSAGKSMSGRFGISSRAGGISAGIGTASGLAIKGAAGLAVKGVRALMRDKAAYEKEMNYYNKALGIIDFAAGGIDSFELIPRIEEQAEQGNRIAQFVLGSAYAEGRGVEPDEQTAFGWFEKAAKNGEMRSRNIVCSEYLYGEEDYGVEKKRIGLGYLIDLANNGAEWAPGLILDIFFMGSVPGLPEDYEKAVYYAKKYASEGNADALQLFSGIYDSAVNNGSIPELAKYRDDEKAVIAYQKLIELGNPDYSGNAAFDLGEMFAEGRGVIENKQEAFNYYSIASEYGNLNAKAKLMQAYYFGNGVEKSNIDAAKYANQIVNSNADDYLPEAYYCLHKCADETEQYGDSMRYAKAYIACKKAKPEKKEELLQYLNEMETKLSQMTEAEKRAFLKEARATSKSTGGKLVAVILIIIIAVIGLIIFAQNNNDEYTSDDSYSSEEYAGSEEVEEQDTGEAYDPGSYDGYEDDFIIPGSDERFIYDEDVADLSDEDTQMAINEIYARHGRIFQDEPYASHFDSCEWYEPTYTADEFDESWFNDYEKENIKVLAAHREGESADESGNEEEFTKHPVESEEEAVEYCKEYYESTGGEINDDFVIRKNGYDEEGYSVYAFYDTDTLSTAEMLWTVTTEGDIYDHATEEWVL